VRTKIAVLLSFLLLFSNAPLADGIEVRADLDEGADEEASAIDDFAISLRSNQSGRFRNPQLRTKLSVKALRAIRVRVEDSRNKISIDFKRSIASKNPPLVLSLILWG
jgi:hypothetical protein